MKAMGETLFSLCFRASVFVFLRVIPTTLAQLLVPTLFVAWLSTACLSHPHDSITTSHDPLTTLLLSLPTRSQTLRRLNAAINFLLLLAALDFVAYPFIDSAEDVVFTRVGALYHDAAKVVVRYPRVGPVHIVYRHPTSNWTTGPPLLLTEENDWVDTVVLNGLYPKTKYEYKLLSSLNGTFLPYPPNPIKFRTFPDPQLASHSRFRFAVTSCITPNFPYVPSQGRRIKGFALLADYLGLNGPYASSAASTNKFTPMEFMLFLGDFIYADVPVYIGDSKEAYRRLYRRNYQSPDFRKIYESFPIFHTYDDHEIENNFEGKSNDSNPPFPSASDAFKLYNANANYHSYDQDQHYYEFRYGDVAYFVMDTRRYRSGINVTTPTMLGEKQLTDLYSWLGRVNNTATFKFIVSSVPFTSLWGHDAQIDSWAAYRAEKSALLKTIHTIPNVFFLSGDRHEFAAIEFNTDQGFPVYEFSTSPLNMFYIPFFRTLAPHSLEMVSRLTNVPFTEDTDQPTTVYEDVPQERVIKYLPHGNHKWSMIEVDTKNPDAPVLKLQVIIDGLLRYSHEIVGHPVALPAGDGVGILTPFHNLFAKLGTNPRKWF